MTASASPPPDASEVFAYQAQTAEGRTIRGALEAPTIAAAQEQLAALQLRILSLEPAPAAPRRRLPLGPDDFLIFNQQLAHLTAAGLPVEAGLRLVAADIHSGRLAGAARDVAAELERGVPLEEAFSRHTSRFPPLYGRLVEAGVKAGNLPAMLFNLGHHLDLVARLRQSLWRTLAYPLLVLAAMSLVLLFISLAVLPQFEAMYGDFRTTLPGLTSLIFLLGHIYPYFLIAVACIALALLLTSLAYRVTGRSDRLRDQVGIRIPIVGPVLRASLLARWIDALRLAVEAGLDLPRAIRLASDATASTALSAEAQTLADSLAAGGAPRLIAGRLIPPTIPAAIDLAAHSGDLPSTLATLARMYQSQTEHRLRLVPVVFTPLGLMAIGGTVILAIAALFLPLFKLIQSVSG